MFSARTICLLYVLTASVVPAFADSIELVGSGSGFFVNSDGWIVTNAHVLKRCSTAAVPNYGILTDWKIDREDDLAAARLFGSVPGAVLPLRGTSARLGEDVAALGYPLAGTLSKSVKITTGNINALDGIADDPRYLQISAAIQPGNSGGPLVDRQGSLIGITTATLERDADNQASVLQNVNFAIKASNVAEFLTYHSLAFSQANDGLPALFTVDLAEAVRPATVQVLCFQNRIEAHPALVTPANPSMPGPKPEEPEAAAPPGGNVTVSHPARWQSLVVAKIRQNTQRPAGIVGSGTVSVSFVIDGTGKVISTRVSRSSGDATLDEAALAIVRRASPLPPPPDGVSIRKLSVPIRFN